MTPIFNIANSYTTNYYTELSTAMRLHCHIAVDNGKYLYK